MERFELRISFGKSIPPNTAEKIYEKIVEMLSHDSEIHSWVSDYNLLKVGAMSATEFDFGRDFEERKNVD